ncbi:MAG: hypothetical protein M1834_006622 [Cirrosporium novae-zelandiae]|nr:MAG: hypothetical protein M1834_006622 [Cirrosporium novae-zelandiae]
MDNSQEDVSLETIELLEDRLRRLEYLVTGSSSLQNNHDAETTATESKPVSTRLQELDSSLRMLRSRFRSVHDLLILETESRYPDLFHAIPPADIPSSLDPSEIASIVLSCASSFPETASRLNSIKDLPIPSAETSAALIALSPRLEKIAARQRTQTQELADLRAHSAAVLERWYELSVLDGGECWAEWESRLEKVERQIKRQEHIQAQEKIA